MVITHTDYCIEQTRKQQTFYDTHPNACRACGARGYVSFFNRIDKYGGEWMADPCTLCVEEGRCPLCASQSLDDDAIQCSACNFDAENPTEVASDWYCDCDYLEEDIDGN